MAQKKAKAEKSASNDAPVDGTALILDYLQKQNRPYSAIEISTNLHNKVTKAYTVKALRELHQSKEIECRVAGKQTVYHALQEALDEAGQNIVAAMGEEIEELQEQLTGLKDSEKKVQAELTSLCATPLVSELRDEIEKLEEEIQSLTASLAKNNGGDSMHETPQERAEVMKNWKLWQKQANVRAQICRDLWRKCSETLPEDMRSREELWEHLGLEGPRMT